MGRAITQDVYDKLLESFRKDPGNYERARKHAGTDWRTAKRAYEIGWPKKGLKSGKQALIDEQIATRARLQAEHAAKIAAQEKERDQARQQAVQSRMQEGQMVVLARAASLQAITISTQLLGGARKLAEMVKKQLEAEAAKTQDTWSPAQSINILERVTRISSQINSAAYQAMQMERLHLGQPTDIIANVDAGTVEDMTLEEAKIRIEAAQQALDSVEKGKLVLIQGGQGVDMNDNGKTGSGA